jgi:hypothetical protein
MISREKKRAAEVVVIAARRVKDLCAASSLASVQAGNVKEFMKDFSHLPAFLSRNQKNHPVFPDFAVFDSYTQR